METVYRWTGRLGVGLLLLLALLLWFSPSERTLGQTIKLVYLHGALVQTAILLFAISLPVNVAALIRGRGDRIAAWGQALIWTATLVWIMHTILSMLTTYAAWGVFIAWFEPRTRFTFAVMLGSLVMVAVAYLIADPRFSSLTFVLLAGLILGLLPRLGFIQHPLDPIGSSPSRTIQLFYIAILVVSIALAGLAAVWLKNKIASGR